MAGGAEKVARDLFESYRRMGHRSRLAVGHRRGPPDPDILEIAHEPYRSIWTRSCRTVAGRLAALPRLQNRIEHNLAQPIRSLRGRWGHEDFDFPGTWRLLDLPGGRPDILHLHNLHGGYFDLRALAWLSRQLPVFVTLHDTWMLSGHCAYSLGCDRWKTGCGNCPDLSIYPAIRADATAYNWRRKLSIYRDSRLRIAAPCRWMLEQLEQSMLIEGEVESRIIHNGVDLTLFNAQDRAAARIRLGLPSDRPVLLFAANKGRANPFKDHDTIVNAVARLGDRRMILLMLGQAGPAQTHAGVTMIMAPPVTDPAVMADYYRSADIFLHAARADNFPCTILEALACGTPVVATDIGGVSEQIIDGQTGFLVPPQDPDAMANRIARLLDDPSLLQRLSPAAAYDAAQRFDLRQQVLHYLTWYEQVHLHRTTDIPPLPPVEKNPRRPSTFIPVSTTSER